VDQDLESIANLVHLDLERFLASRHAELQLCSEVEAMDDVVVDDSHFRIQNELMRLARTYPSIYEELLVTKGPGLEVVASTNVQRIGSAWPVDPARLLLAEGGGRTGVGPESRPGAAGPVLVIARPVRSSVSHEQVGWLVALVRWSALDDLVRGAAMLGEPAERGRVRRAHVGQPPDRRPRRAAAGRASHRRSVSTITSARTRTRGTTAVTTRSVDVASDPGPVGWRVLVYRDPTRRSPSCAGSRGASWAGVLGRCCPRASPTCSHAASPGVSTTWPKARGGRPRASTRTA
jgi:hypothetical protein